MTRKDYVLIADAMRRSRPLATTEAGRKLCAAELETFRLCCDQLAAMLAGDNARFDRSRFLKACGVED